MLGATSLLCLPLAAQKNQPKNILFILADDLGWKDLSCTGSDYYESPNIDRIAQNGIRFTNGYAACSVSSPSRASILTGQYTPRHGITSWIGDPAGEAWRKNNRCTKLLPPDYARELPKATITLAERLKAHGYKTFFAGKWHLGDVGSDPENHGFEINIGGWESGSPKGGYFSPYSNPRLPDGPKGENLSIRLANETNKFIEQHIKKNKKQPFLAYLSFYAVHAPIQTTRERWEYFREKAEKQGIQETGFVFDRRLPVRQVQDDPVYAGLIQQMDDAVGIVLNKLKELGLDKNTLIVFTSDNGGVSSGDNYATSNLPLRGGKGRQWEGGVRVPFLMQIPGTTSPHTTSAIPVIGTDFYPTLLDYAGIPMPAGQVCDGISLLPVIQGKDIPSRALFWHYPHYGNQGGDPASSIREGDWKLIYYYEDNRYELYNLAIDATESEFMNAQYPEKLNELRIKLNAWLSGIHATTPVADPQYDPVKESGYLKNQQQSVSLREKQRLEKLQPEWSPNKDWWKSMIIPD